ncbi:MAG: glycosyltransferase family 2 protein [Bacteroidota bacterium]
MKVTGFTFIRNAVKYDYPVVEAIRSILPVCDDFIVVVGNSDDETRELIAAIDPQKITIIDSVWDDTQRSGGRVLALETNKAMDAIPADTDWCFYIQGDEVVHEDDLPAIRKAMETSVNDKNVEGLVFNYRHFYGSYDYVGDSRRWYRREVRIIRNNPAIRSFRDAQGFQLNGHPLRVKPANGWINHYGWVKAPELQQAKQQYFHSLWHDDEWVKKNVGSSTEFDYSGISHLAHFTGTHPQVMQARIASKNWHFTFDPTARNLGFKNNLLHWVEKKTGWRIGEYKNYKIVKN